MENIVAVFGKCSLPQVVSKLCSVKVVPPRCCLDSLNRSLQFFFHKGPDSEYFRLWTIHSFLQLLTYVTVAESSQKRMNVAVFQ